jgi:chorismate mutase
MRHAKPLASRNKVVEEARKWKLAEEAAFLERQREEAMKRKRKAEEFEAEFDKSIGGPLPPKIMNPSVSCKNQSKTTGFTVWSSCGYGNDGLHSHTARPEMQFDSTYPSRNEAEKRARYLFFKKIPYGLGYQDMSDEHGYNKFSWSLMEGHSRTFGLRVAPPDSEVWTVGVLSAKAFRSSAAAYN